MREKRRAGVVFRCDSPLNVLVCGSAPEGWGGGETGVRVTGNASDFHVCPPHPSKSSGDVLLKAC